MHLLRYDRVQIIRIIFVILCVCRLPEDVGVGSYHELCFVHFCIPLSAFIGYYTEPYPYNQFNDC